MQFTIAECIMPPHYKHNISAIMHTLHKYTNIHCTDTTTTFNFCLTGLFFPELLRVMPGSHHSVVSSVAVSPFCRCKIPLFCKNYVRTFRSVTAVNSKKICNGSGNGVRKWQWLTETEERQRNDGNRVLGMVPKSQHLGMVGAGLIISRMPFLSATSSVKALNLV